MKNCIFIVFTFLLIGCSATEVKDVKEPEKNEASEVPIAKRIYYFQHNLIRDWLFESDGEFFFDMKNGDVDYLIQAAAEIVNPEYADEIYITPIAGKDAVSIRFPEPNAYANCYYSIIKKDGDVFSYYTYEKTMNFGDESIVGVVGSWDSEGRHSNFGARGYSSEEEFIEDILASY